MHGATINMIDYLVVMLKLTHGEFLWSVSVLIFCAEQSYKLTPRNDPSATETNSKMSERFSP